METAAPLLTVASFAWVSIRICFTAGSPLRPQAPFSSPEDSWMRQSQVKAESWLHSFLVCLSGLLGIVTLQDNLACVWAFSMHRTSIFTVASVAKFLCRVASNYCPPMALISRFPGSQTLAEQKYSHTLPPPKKKILFTSRFPHGCLSSYSKPCIL